ncbi:F-box protein At1g61340-like [Andrographis paniculata]|uniref:F-box protein At1g61340-like n=1 Tax=Andrographis paniculata TaxID=175694 RepID=UPI0021E7C48D|nr:F-box protein At1g61340-like [Andrographis paniculata]
MKKFVPIRRSSEKQSCLSVLKSAALEDLPQEILIRVLCGVDHADLKTLSFVSKSIRAAALMAKQSHFAFSTPRKNSTFLNTKPEDFGFFDEVEAPNAPKQRRIRRSRLNAKKLADLSVSLFTSDDDSNCWQRRKLFHQINIPIQSAMLEN